MGIRAEARRQKDAISVVRVLGIVPSLLVLLGRRLENGWVALGIYTCQLFSKAVPTAGLGD